VFEDVHLCMCVDMHLGMCLCVLCEQMSVDVFGEVHVCVYVCMCMCDMSPGEGALPCLWLISVGVCVWTRMGVCAVGGWSCIVKNLCLCDVCECECVDVVWMAVHV